MAVSSFILKGDFLMKKNVERIKLDGAKLNKDFIVVSQYALTDDWDCVPYQKGMDGSNIQDIIDTPFQSELIEFVYDVGPTVDVPLAVQLGLGVIKSLSDGSLLLYNADTQDYEDRLTDEKLRLGMYYQIKHPEYDDRQLDYILQTKGGPDYLVNLHFCNTVEPIDKLMDIFAAKKGKRDNVINIEFKKY